MTVLSSNCRVKLLLDNHTIMFGVWLNSQGFRSRRQRSDGVPDLQDRSVLTE